MQQTTNRKRKERRGEVWISKRKFQELEKRIADLEDKVQGQRKEINFLMNPYKSIRQAFAELSRQK